jgi:hypothetical protein
MKLFYLTRLSDMRNLGTAGITDETKVWRVFKYELPKEYNENNVKSIGIYINF